MAVHWAGGPAVQDDPCPDHDDDVWASLLRDLRRGGPVAIGPTAAAVAAIVLVALILIPGR